MSKFFEKYDCIGAIAGAKAFKRDIEEIEAKAQKAWEEGFDESEASKEDLYLAIIEAVLQLHERKTDDCGTIKDRGYIVYEAAQNIKIARDYEEKDENEQNEKD